MEDLPVVRETSVEVHRPHQIALTFTEEEKKLFLGKLTSSEQLTALRVVNHLQLDPIKGQIHFWPYGQVGSDNRKMVWYVSRDGMLSCVARTGTFGGIEEELLFYESKAADGKPVLTPYETFDPNDCVRLISATVKVRKKDDPVLKKGTAIFASYVKEGKGGEVWLKFPEDMLLKVALRKALKMGWPEETVGIYTEEEVRTHIVDSTAREVEPRKGVLTPGSFKPKPPEEREGAQAPESPEPTSEPGRATTPDERPTPAPTFPENLALWEDFKASLKEQGVDNSAFQQMWKKAKSEFGFDTEEDIVKVEPAVFEPFIMGLYEEWKEGRTTA